MEYKVVWAITLLLVGFLISFAFLNLFILFDEGNCVCTPCAGQCTEKGEQVIDCLDGKEGGIDCQSVSCKDLFGKCTGMPKYLDLKYYILGE